MSKSIRQDGAAPRRRRRWTAAEKSACLAAFATSGRSTTAFCRETGVPRATLRLWQRASRVAGPVPPLEGAPPPAFAVVELVAAAGLAPTPSVPATPVAPMLTLVVRAPTGLEATLTGVDAATGIALLCAVFGVRRAGAA